MSGETPPPEVPEEFAEAYREAYRQALAHREQEAESLARGQRERPDLRAAGGWLRERITGMSPLSVGLVAALVILLVLGAYVVGRLVSGPPSHRARTYQGGYHAGGHHPRRPASTGSSAWQGKVTKARISGASATCTAKPGVDSAGHPVTYEVANAYDGVRDTAWRCGGSARGVSLTFNLGRPARVGEVGLIAGYAKTDPVSHADRYAQNNRITRVRWTIGKEQIVQRLDGGAHHRAIQLLRIPPVRTGVVTLQILDVTPGPRNTTAISEIRLGSVSASL